MTQDDVIDPRRILDDLVAKLRDPQVLQDVESILSSYNGLDKTTIISTQGALIPSLTMILGANEAQALWFIITLWGDQMSDVLNSCKDEKTQQFLSRINAIYSPIFAGCNTFISDDWARLSWNYSADTSNKTPILELTVLKRNGDHFKIRSSMTGWLTFVEYVLTNLHTSIEIAKPTLDDSVKEALGRIKTMTNTIENFSPNK